MKKINLIFLILLLLEFNAKAIKIKFAAANMSVNVADGTRAIFSSFQVFPDDYTNPDTLELLNFPSVDYKDIASIRIERKMLSAFIETSFSIIAEKSITSVSTGVKNTSDDFIQGNTYVYRFSVITNSNQQINLTDKALTTQASYPAINCAKFYDAYRLACHNCFQKDIVSPFDGGFYQALYYTRVVEADIHNGASGTWYVAHTGSSDNNNCGHNTSGNNGLSYCLADLQAWHTANPGHDPIVMHIDLKDDFNSSHTPLMLDNLLMSMFSLFPIYKPKDLLGTYTDMRLAAQDNNWPSMGDLQGKFIFVLTGGPKVNGYISDRGLDAIAFAAGNVNHYNDAITLPDIWSGYENRIVFSNINLDDMSNHGGNVAHQNRFINRVWDATTFGQPAVLSNGDYSNAITENINHIAVKDIDGSYNPSGNPVNGILPSAGITNPVLSQDHIYSSYANVTQTAVQTLSAINLIVEPGAHYRMMAGTSINMIGEVAFKANSDVGAKIDNCSSASYLRHAGQEELSQEQIERIMNELSKDLYTHVPNDKEKIVRLAVYPNPANDIINISYNNFSIIDAVFTLHDLTGRIIKTKTYSPQYEGVQGFSVDIKELHDGIYLYTLQVGGQDFNGKITKINN